MLSGLLPVYKPANLVSKDVSRWLVRRLGKLKIGHVGTLDPMAEGVLPILLGKATRLQDRLLADPKIYEFGIKFGIETDTLDIQGAVLKEQPVKTFAAEEIAAVLPSLRGAINQAPPLYSAVKFKGKALYKYARQGEANAVPLANLTRKVFVHELTLLSCDQERALLRVQCSKGTYVRVLAQQIAARLGTLGTVDYIKRTASAGVNVEQTVTLERLESDLANFSSYLIPIEKINIQDQIHWLCADERAEKKLRMGQAVRLSWGVFAQGIQTKGNRQASVHGSKTQLTLLDPQGSAFGLGVANAFEDDNVQILMQRELK